MVRLIKWLLIIVAVVCGAVLYYQPAGFDILRKDRSHSEIIKIIDGDTFEIRYEGRLEKVRLIGIDTPETRDNEKAEKDAARSGADLNVIIQEGRAAKKFVEEQFPPGTRVHVELDVQPRDKYGRLLVYLYLDDGRMINEEIVKNGYANLLTYPPNVRYRDRFQSAYHSARSGKMGLWKK